MRLAALAAALAFFTAAPGALAADREGRLIQIGIIPKTQKLSFTFEGAFRVEDGDGNSHKLEPHKSYAVEPSEGGLALGELKLPPSARFQPVDPDAVVTIGKHRYQGNLVVRLNSGKDALAAIIELGIENYLLGVLPHEMDSDWPLEALKAQAVVARTFAYTQLGKYKKDGFDLTSDTRSQMFAGLTAQSAAARRAIEETRGEVLGYKGDILNVYYHSCCGGHTENAGAVWGGQDTPRPLWGVRDRYCNKSPHGRWTAYFPYSDILTAVEKALAVTGALRRFDVGRLDAAGYARTFLLKVGSERLTVKAEDFRRWMGNSQLRSLFITRIRRSRDGVEFIGKGSGHGVGLCQWGARIQAEKGRSYQKILSFYFPGSTLSVIDS